MESFFVALANCIESSKKFEFKKDEKKLRIEFVETRDDVDILHSIRLEAWARDRKEEGSPWFKDRYKLQ